MKNMKLPEDLQKRVIHFLMSTHTTLDAQTELDDFLKMLSPSLKAEVIKHIFAKVINSNDQMRGNDALISYIVRKLDIVLT